MTIIPIVLLAGLAAVLCYGAALIVWEKLLRPMLRREIRQVLEDDARAIREDRAFQPVSVRVK